MKPFVIICIVWFIGWFYNILYACPTSVIVDGRCLAYGFFPNAVSAGITGVSMVLYFALIPSFIMIACLSHMAYILHKRMRQTAPIGINSTFNRAKINIIKTLCLFLATILCCWSFCIWAFFLSFFNVIYLSFYSTWPYHFSVLLIMFSCTVNPFIYAVHYKKFKEGQKKFFEIFCLNKQPVAGNNLRTVTNEPCISTVA